jgi:hypothetical protein
METPLWKKFQVNGINRATNIDMKIKAKDSFFMSVKSTVRQRDQPQESSTHRIYIPQTFADTFLNMLTAAEEITLQPLLEDGKKGSSLLYSRKSVEEAATMVLEIITVKGSVGRDRMVVLTVSNRNKMDFVSVPWVHLPRFVQHARNLRARWGTRIESGFDY